MKTSSWWKTTRISSAWQWFTVVTWVVLREMFCGRYSPDNRMKCAGCALIIRRGSLWSHLQTVSPRNLGVAGWDCRKRKLPGCCTDSRLICPSLTPLLTVVRWPMRVIEFTNCLINPSHYHNTKRFQCVIGYTGRQTRHGDSKGHTEQLTPSNLTVSSSTSEEWQTWMLISDPRRFMEDKDRNISDANIMY